MKPVAVKFELATKGSESSSVVARFYFSGKPFKFYPGVSVEVKSWKSEKQRLDTRKSHAWEINGILDRVEKAIQNSIYSFHRNRIDEVSVKQMKFTVKSEIERMENEEEPEIITDFVEDFFNMWIKEKAKNKKNSKYEQRHRLVINNALAVRPNLKFSNINDSFFQDFIQYLIEEENNVDSTIYLKVSQLKKICNEAVRYGYRVNPMIRHFTYTSYDVPAVFLNWDEVEALQNLKNLSEKERYHRDRFIFRCYTGIRFSEMKYLHAGMIRETGGFKELVSNSEKTIKLNHIHLPDAAYKIWESWDFDMNRFPTINRDNKEGQMMKFLAELAELNRPIQIIRYQGGKPIVTISPIHKIISTHTARRTYARAWYDRGGDPILLQDKLGHYDLKTTLKYIGIQKQESTREAARLFG